MGAAALSRLDWTPEEFVDRYRQGVAKGVVLAATNRWQLANEKTINGFVAGLFTHSLTEYLWRETATPESAIAYTRSLIAPDLKQAPLAEIQAGSHYDTQSLYFLDLPNPWANAVVTEVEGDRAQLWLGGLDGASFGKLEEGTTFVGVGGSGKVTMRSRQGLVAEVTVEEAVTEGTLLRLGT